MTPYKVVIRTICCLTFFFYITKTGAQVRLAAFGGIHSANIIEHNSIPGWDTAQKKFFSAKTGFELGVLAEIPIGKKGFYFQPGINYSSKGRNYQQNYDTSGSQKDTVYAQNSVKLAYIEIPAYFTYKFRLSADQKNNFFLSAGPYFAFIYSASQDYQNQTYNYTDGKYEFNSGTADLPVGNARGEYRTADIGIAARAGFELGNVMLNAYYSHGFSNTYTADYPASFHHTLIGASLGIWLTKSTPPSRVKKDSDHDGIADGEDACPLVPGSPKWRGCPVPDTDHDGVDDDHDSCVAVPGLARYHGCPIPDTDGDGINDEEDSCKNIAGLPRYHGCPIPDRDGDGVNDEEDKCPDVPGTAANGGCPAIKQQTIEKINFVASNVQFRTASTRLTDASYPALRELADTLRTNPGTQLTIKGFTDNTGRPKYNVRLSKQRAEVVKAVLVKMKIPADRIITQGFGMENPIGDNRTREGRTRNRRVEFVLGNPPAVHVN
jgi:OmpA-OmpF porin, OOP family